MSALNSDVFWLKQAAAPEALFKTRYRNSELTLTRFRHLGDQPKVYEAIADDAYVAIIHIASRPEHASNLGHNDHHQTAGSEDSFNFADLSTSPRCLITGPMDNFHLHIPRAALDDIADEADSPRIDRLHLVEGWETPDAILSSIKTTMVAAAERPDQTSQLFIDHMVLALHAHFARSYGGMRDAERRRSGGLAPWQERRAKELIAASLSKELSLVEIASECDLSMAHFSRAFKASAGMTPHGWLQACRIEHAKEIMLQPHLALAEIAVSCGFADQSHFTRIFTRIEGDTPGVWRRYRRAA